MQQLIVDLDHTLLDTTALKAALAKSLGLSVHDWDAAYTKAVEDYGGIFNPEDFLAGVATDQREAFYATLKKAQQFLYPDSIAFLKQALTDGWAVQILTFGNPSWQQQKMQNIQWPTGVECVATDGLKPKLLQEFANETLVVIDDNAKEIDAIKQAYPTTVAYWMRRPNGKYRELQPKEYDTMIEDLNFKLPTL